MKSSLASVVLSSIPLLLSAPAFAQEFSEGDLYLVSQGLPNGPGMAQQGIMRVDIATGAATLVTTLQSVQRSATYDSYRDRLAVNCTINNQSGLYFIDSLGNSAFSGLNNSQAFRVAAAGDGRVYCLDAATRKFHIIDPVGGVSDLMDASGTAAYALGGNAFNSNGTDLCFDAATNSLFFVNWTYAADCGFPSGTVPQITKIPLNTAGTQVYGFVIAAPVCLPLDAPQYGADYSAIPLSAGPGGKIFLSIDDNTNSQFARMALIDPVTLVSTAYAKNGPYVGAASTMTGVYSHALGRGVILDSFADALRVFSFGEVGNGSFFGNPGDFSSTTGSSETVKMIEIHGSSTHGGLTVYGTGTPGCAGAHGIGATKAPKANISGFRITSTNAPPSSLGLLLVGNEPDLAGSDPIGLGVLFHIDFFASTELYGYDINSNQFGYGISPFDIALSPSIIGLTYDVQAIWAWTSCSPSIYGLSSTPGMAITILP